MSAKPLWIAFGIAMGFLLAEMSASTLHDLGAFLPEWAMGPWGIVCLGLAVVFWFWFVKLSVRWGGRFEKRVVEHPAGLHLLEFVMLSLGIAFSVIHLLGLAHGYIRK